MGGRALGGVRRAHAGQSGAAPGLPSSASKTLKQRLQVSWDMG
jgi:hypothetical protein